MRRLLAILWLLAPVSAHAQPEPIAIEHGFTPDPARQTGRTAGALALSTRAPSCRGYAGEAPDHLLELREDFAFLRFFVLAAQDVTLAVRAPDGGWRCVSARGEVAALQEGRFAAGRYEVFVGGPTQGERVFYELVVTEFRSVGPREEREAATSSARAEVGLEVERPEGTGRDRRIRRGFLPDPIEDRGAAGGAIDARALGASCRGFVAAGPTHVLTLRDEFDYLRVQLGGAPGLATLVLRTPGGRYLCSAPEQGNAFIDQDVWPEGVYRIWVGASVADAQVSYRICYTEARLSEAAATCGRDLAPGEAPPPPREYD
ncbi:MAG: hypothetical protein KF729_29340 [Sandaracinaceae bacterium]|nr:hypothetical protein [Sandaracinaceae bacterium]